MTGKEFIFYYKFKNDKNTVFETASVYSQLYKDENCTEIAGYYSVNKKLNIIDDTNNSIQNISITIYFDEKIISYNYVRKNQDEINTPISYYNFWVPNTPIGYINRKILPDNSRKISIFL